MLKHKLKGHCKVDTNNCWNWTRCVSKNGYGKYKTKDKTWQVHRLSYILYKGPVPKDKFVLHKCDNRRCLNPDHLYVGTIAQNILDALSRDRWPLKLTNSQILEIRKATGRQEDLAKHYGVSQPQISRIKSGKTRQTLYGTI